MGGNIGNNIDNKYLDNMDTYNKIAYEYLTDANDNWKKGTGLNSNFGRDFLGRTGTNISDYITDKDDDYNLSWLPGAKNADREALMNALISAWAIENPTKSVDEDVLKRFDNLTSKLIIAKDRDLINKSAYKNLVQNLGVYPEGSTGISKDRPIEDILNMSTNAHQVEPFGFVSTIRSNIYYDSLQEARNKGILAQQDIIRAKEEKEKAYNKPEAKAKREAIEEFMSGYYLAGLDGYSKEYLEENKDEMESLGLDLKKVEDLAKQYR